MNKMLMIALLVASSNAVADFHVDILINGVKSAEATVSDKEILKAGQTNVWFTYRRVDDTDTDRMTPSFKYIDYDCSATKVVSADNVTGNPVKYGEPETKAGEYACNVIKNRK